MDFTVSNSDRSLLSTQVQLRTLSTPGVSLPFLLTDMALLAFYNVYGYHVVHQLCFVDIANYILVKLNYLSVEGLLVLSLLVDAC